MAENKQRFPGFVGPSYTLRAGRFDCERLVNMYIEVDELGAGKGGEPAVMISTPGLKFLQTIGSGPIRACYTLSNQSVSYIVSGNELYQLSGNVSSPVLVTGNLTTSQGPVSIADNGISVMIVDGINGYYVDIGTTVLNTITSANFYPADVVSFQDGYFILNRTGTIYFFLSDLYATTFPALNLEGKSGNSDILIAAVSNSRELYLFGAHTLEIWWNQGASGSSPFARQDGAFSQQGCAAPYSIAQLGETLVWLGSNPQGGGVVYQLQNAVPTRISTHAVEFAIQQLGDLSGAVAYGYQQEGHWFYVINIPGSETTWVFDTDSKSWHERQSTVNGTIGRHLGQNHCVLNGNHLVGDYRSANLYQYDLNTYTDNGHSRLKRRQSPHSSASLNNMFYRLFELDAQFGVGLVDNGTNTDANVQPRVVLQMSNDGGETWGNPIYASLGKIGAYRTRARWQRLGYARDRVFRVDVTDDVKVQYLSAYMDTDPGYA